jgi:uncharacterized protein (DUF433 family)
MTVKRPRRTTRGKDPDAEGASVPFSARLPRSTREGLREYARQSGTSESAAASRLIEEGLRMARFPGIDFRWAPTGRQPCVTGTGLTVWEMHEIWKAFGKRADKVVARYPHLAPAQIGAGVAYAEGYSHEMPRGMWGVKPPFAREVRV